MNATKLDQLPDLCLRKIFAFLRLRDRVKCRAVCRLFKFYADETRVDELVVKSWYSSYDYDRSCSDYQGRCDVWYLTDRKIDFSNSISVVGFFSMRSSLKLNQRLKFLHVHLGYPDDFDFKLFDDLNQLVHLEIRIECSANTPKTLALPNLKVLDVKNFWVKYILNTPKLEVLACESIEKTQVEHPETIKRLACKYRVDPVVSKFKNLKVLTFLNAGHYELCPISLSDWKHLKELNLTMVPSGYGQDKYEQLMSWVVSLMRQRADLQRDELKLYLADVLLVDEKQLHWTQANSEDLRLKNPQFLRHDTYPNVSELRFERLVELGVELSTEFFRRFPAIKKLTARAPFEPHSLEWFLENATELRHLILWRTLLNQTFMNRLPNIASRLNYLEVWSEGSRLITDFHFILRLEHLRTFQTDHQFDSLELVAKAYQQLKELVRVEFPVGKEKVEISRRLGYEYFEALKKGSSEECPKDEYRLFIRKENGTRKLDRGRVKWAKLEALYDQNRAQQTSLPVEAKAKRARLR